MRRVMLALSLFAAAALTTGCTSPEATRTRGGGSGGDVGNHGQSVELHGKLDPFRGTPQKAHGR